MRRAARLSTWPPTVIPMCAISPAAWNAVVTISGADDGVLARRGLSFGGGGFGVAGRAARRCAAAFFSAVAARDAAVGRVAFGFARFVAASNFAAAALAAEGFAAGAFAFAAGAFAAGGFAGFAFVAVAVRAGSALAVVALFRRPMRSGRVAGRLPSTLGCPALDFLDFFGLPDLSLISSCGTLARARSTVIGPSGCAGSLKAENIAPRLTKR